MLIAARKLSWASGKNGCVAMLDPRTIGRARAGRPAPARQ